MLSHGPDRQAYVWQLIPSKIRKGGGFGMAVSDVPHVVS